MSRHYTLTVMSGRPGKCVNKWRQTAFGVNKKGEISVNNLTKFIHWSCSFFIASWFSDAAIIRFSSFDEFRKLFSERRINKVLFIPVFFKSPLQYPNVRFCNKYCQSNVTQTKCNYESAETLRWLYCVIMRFAEFIGCCNVSKNNPFLLNHWKMDLFHQSVLKN